MCVGGLLFFSSAYIMKSLSPARLLLSYIHIHIYDSSSPSVRASGARGRNALTPYIPVLPVPVYHKLLQPPHPTLHACPTPAHLLHEHVVRRCGCVLPVIGYYLLRHLLAKLLHLNLIDRVESLLKKKGLLNSPDNLQLWPIAQPLYKIEHEKRIRHGPNIFTTQT